MTIQEKFSNAGQSQVFKFFDSLSEEEKKSLLAQLEQVDLGELNTLLDELVFKTQTAESGIDFAKLSPAPFTPLPEDKASDPVWKEAKEIGEAAIRAGRLAAFVVAGGQGTRLGFNAPKGLYKVSPVKQKSLFQIFAEKILSAQRKYGVKIPWLIMTSHINNDATRAFFEENNFFGLDKNDVIFFKQGLMPAVDKTAR